MEAYCLKNQDEELWKVKEKLDREEKSLFMAVYEAVVDEALRYYPYVLQHLFSTSLLSTISIVSLRGSHSRVLGKRIRQVTSSCNENFVGCLIVRSITLPGNRLSLS